VTTDESARTIPTESPRSAMRVRAGTEWSLDRPGTTEGPRASEPQARPLEPLFLAHG